MTLNDYSLGQTIIGRWQRMSAIEKLEESNLQTFIESVIAVRAHALSMDVKSERKQMSLLIMSVLTEFQNTK